MASVPSPLVIAPREPAGTVASQEVRGDQRPPRSPTKQATSPTDAEALESAQVIELQTFIERKAWIEEKIKFLEKLPPIEVFVGIEALRTSAEEVPGLPTRAQLQQWLVEHDIIEKETEIFDTGELKKLRKFTRAATQRNLSPEDTDLIELTLTTIYELDKLLHLLRDRSESYDLLGVRLSWEECRIASWVSRRTLIDDLKTFLSTRARWAPNVYETTAAAAGDAAGVSSLRRRGSAASLVSITSEVLPQPGFSRTARFTHAESLSRDSAHYGARVSTLRHGTITTAGKHLDKLIENSRRAVPDELLDEQDRLEELGIGQMENIGKFVMNVVMQWRKADEIYVETIKDQTSARALLDEILAASEQHPIARLSSSFTSRIDTIRKRLILRGDPAARGSVFPCPVHPLFPEQDPFNTLLVKTLSSEVRTALLAMKEAEAAANKYRAASEAVKTFEGLIETGATITTQLDDILKRLTDGVSADNGDGSPPDLSSDACLRPMAHSVFLALLPSIFKELDEVNQRTALLLRQVPASMLRLTPPGIDSAFKQNGLKVFEDLKAKVDSAASLRADLTTRVTTLREARRLDSLINGRTKDAEALLKEVEMAMLKHRWQPTTHPVSTSNGAPPTPDSPPTIPLPALASDIDFQEQFEDLSASVKDTINKPFAALSASLQPNLKASLHQSLEDLMKLLEDGRQATTTLASIKAQAANMSALQSEVDSWRMRIEDLRMQFDTIMDDTLEQDAFFQLERQLTESHQSIRQDVMAFVDSLPSRVRFVDASAHSHSHSPPTPRRKSSDSYPLPFTLRSLDDAVRHDCNAYAMTLNGDLRVLETRMSHLQLARLARDVDESVAASRAALAAGTADLATLKAAHGDIPRGVDMLSSLALLAEQLDERVQSTRSAVNQCLSKTRDALTRMGDAPGVHDVTVHEPLYLARVRKQEDVELHLAGWEEQVRQFRQVLDLARQAEEQRREREKLAAEKALREEAERKAEQERLRLEEEERLRREVEEERLRALEAQEAEDQRAAAEAARLAECERLRLVEEERVRVEQERAKAEGERIKAEQERLEHERVEREAMQAKLKEAEAALAAERQAQAERQAEADRAAERMAAEAAKRKAEQEELARVERAKKDEEARLKAHREAENARLAAEAAAQRAEEEERAKLERRRRTEEERLKLEQERMRQEQERLRVEEERQRREAQEREAMQVRLKEAEDALSAERLAQLGRQAEADRIAEQLRVRLAAQAEAQTSSTSAPQNDAEDVFGLKVSTSSPQQHKSQETVDLQVRILNLRRRIRALSLSSRSRPSSQNSLLPNAEEVEKLSNEFASVCEAVAQLPSTIDDQSAQVELESLRHEVEISIDFIERLRLLLAFVTAVAMSDNALSDLLEHIDSYPDPPTGILASTFQEDLTALPEQQMASRFAFIKEAVDTLEKAFKRVSEDPRAVAERDRVAQTWTELQDMAQDRMSGRKSRPSSVISSVTSSGRVSRASLSSMASSNSRRDSLSSMPSTPKLAPPHKKSGSYASLSMGRSSRGGRLSVPAPAPARRVLSSTSDRSSSRMSMSSVGTPPGSRSASHGSVYTGTTFASRQRTNSLTPIDALSPRRPSVGSSLRPRNLGASTSRSGARSPSVLSDVSSTSNMSSVTNATNARSTGSWSRASRMSLPRSTPPKRTIPRKAYVANPKSKLDVAVGEVVNNLPVEINIEGVSGSWKDRSGKYWIGDQDPRLCFCRILRSQTVMVRVGGGWQELSRFIRGHCAERFRVMPESPKAHREDRWISSATLLEAAEIAEGSPPRGPRTPEPSQSPFLPSFVLSTPGHSPHSIGSSPSSKGSPLTPLQFMRRADPEGSFSPRPSTPSKTPSISRARGTSMFGMPQTPQTPKTPTPVWRP